MTFPKAGALREVAAKIPRDRLLVETDSPFLTPVPHRGKRNEPSFVTLVAKQLGALQGLSAEEAGSYTAHNFLQWIERSRRRKTLSRKNS